MRLVFPFSGKDADAQSIRRQWQRAGRERVVRAWRIERPIEVDDRGPFFGQAGVHEAGCAIGFFPAGQILEYDKESTPLLPAHLKGLKLVLLSV